MREMWGIGGVQYLSDHSSFSRANLGDGLSARDAVHETAMRHGSILLRDAILRYLRQRKP